MSTVEHVCVVGDTHEGGTPAIVPSPLRDEAVGRVLDQAIEYCRAQGIFNIVIPGDLYDSPYPSTVSYLALIKRCKETEESLTWHIMNGNHDYETLSNNALLFLKQLVELKVLKNLRVYLNVPERIYLNKLRVVFLPWPHKRSKLLKHAPPSLVFAHVPRAGTSSDTGYVFEDSPETNWPLGKHFWMIGDVHKAQRGPGYEFVGSPLQMDFSESLNKHFCHLKCTISNGGLKVKSERIPIVLPYRLYNETINTVDDLDKLKKYNPSSEFVKVTLPQELRSEVATITQQYPNVLTAPAKRKKKDEEEDVVAKVRQREALTAQTGGMSLRMELLKNSLKKDGFDKQQIKRGLKMAKSAEIEAASK